MRKSAEQVMEDPNYPDEMWKMAAKLEDDYKRLVPIDILFGPTEPAIKLTVPVELSFNQIIEMAYDRAALPLTPIDVDLRHRGAGEAEPKPKYIPKHETLAQYGLSNLNVTDDRYAVVFKADTNVSNYHSPLPVKRLWFVV